VLLWSSGGAEYAWRKARDTGIADLVDSTYSKFRAHPDRQWELPEELVLAPPSVMVDDMPDEVPVVGEVVAVRQYLGPNPHDTGLAELADRLRAG
jgi:hypothetical protein